MHRAVPFQRPIIGFIACKMYVACCRPKDVFPQGITEIAALYLPTYHQLYERKCNYSVYRQIGACHVCVREN